MRLLISIVLLIFVTLSLHAEYLRTIRVASFVHEKDAQEALLILQKFAKNHKKIIKLQEKNEFVFKVKKSGNYYVTLVEPFTQRRVLQVVLDTLRQEYNTVYVRKLKVKPITQKKIIKEEPEIKDEKSQVESMSQKRTIKEEPKIEATKPQIKSEHKNIDITVTQDKQEEKVSKHIWKILFFISFVISLLLLKSRQRYKNENEIYANKELISNEKLEQIVAEITTKEKFLSQASHELRTPMTAILGLIHLVLENELSKSQKDYVQKIENSAKHLLNIINDILDISKLQASELKIEKVEFNINDVLEYVLNVVALQAKNNNVDISMNMANDIPSLVVGDSLRLGQVLINLIANAVKFTQGGEVRLDVKKLSSFGDTIKLEFAVSDTGIGMTEEQVKNIFQSYSQADSSTSRKFGGTGLGLAISKQLVELMHGKIKVESTKDIGSIFTFSIEFNLNNPQNKRQYRLPSSKFLGKKILIIDATSRNVLSLIKSLGYFKYKTYSIPSFEEALLDKDIKYDIIIINEMSLTRFAIEKINDIQNQNESKLVLLSELYSSLHNNLLNEIKVDAYLKTPFTQQSVLNMIIELYVSKNLNSRSRKINVKDKLKELSDKRILVVEDNLINHKVIAGLLSNTGIELIFATNGQEAVNLVLQNEKFDVILMDMHMPVMDGDEASREIRKHAQYNSLPILALTADVMDDAIDKVLASGMQGYIAKPIIVDIFYKKIYDALNTKSTYLNEVVIQKPKDDEEYVEISVSIGLERCENDVKFYKLILKDFKEMYSNSSHALEKLCTASKFKEARSMAMDIKDVSLNIGAYNLCENAATMEYEFEKGNRSQWKKLLDSYQNSLNKLFQDIDKYLEEV